MDACLCHALWAVRLPSLTRDAGQYVWTLIECHVATLNVAAASKELVLRKAVTGAMLPAFS